MPELQIYDRRERIAVGSADVALAVLAGVARPFRRRIRVRQPRRVLLLRLERIGDLIMTLAAIGDLRAALPQAEVTLVVGEWNADIARGIPGITSIETLSASWLARQTQGESWQHMLQHVRRWRRQRFDLAINFEPDVRSNLLVAASGAAWIAGYRSGGGGPMLDQALDYRPTDHTSDNARRLVASVLDAPSPGHAPPRLVIPADADAKAAAAIGPHRGALVAMHVPGGRPVKQWDPDRFAAVANTLIRERGITVALTGAPEDRALVSRVASVLPADSVIDLSGSLDLLTTAAILARAALLITGDTGPMHLAHAVGTPIVAIFGPSDPARYAPRGPFDRVVRVDLPCAPCNRIRLPPARCTGRIPDCLALITPDRVVDAANEILDACMPSSSELRG